MKKIFYGILLLAFALLSMGYLRNYTVESRSKNAFRAQQQDDLNLAISLYTKNIESEISDVSLLEILYFNRGNAYFDASELIKAIRDYTMAIQLNPDFAEAYYNRSLAHYFAGYHKESVDDFKQARECRKDIAQVIKSRGLGYDSMEAISLEENQKKGRLSSIDPSYLKRIMRKTPFY